MKGKPIRLICFHHAGGSSQFFKNWNKSLPNQIEILTPQLPGRWERFKETPIRDMATLTDTLMEEMKGSLDKPFIFFGYSMGALVAFELARALRKTRGPMPLALMVAARSAPQLPLDRTPIYNLPTNQFLNRITELYGAPPKIIMDDREMLSEFVKILKADMELYETYKYYPEEPFDFSIWAYGGTTDLFTSKARLEPWSDHTIRGFYLKFLEGDHFFAQTSEKQFLEVLSNDLGKHLDFQIRKNICQQ